MPLHQLLMYANAQDVDAVVLGGRIVMENRRIDEEEAIIAEARAQSETMLDRAGLRAALSVAPDFWHDAYDRPIRDGINHHRTK